MRDSGRPLVESAKVRAPMAHGARRVGHRRRHTSSKRSARLNCNASPCSYYSPILHDRLQALLCGLAGFVPKRGTPPATSPSWRQAPGSGSRVCGRSEGREEQVPRTGRLLEYTVGAETIVIVRAARGGGCTVYKHVPASRAPPPRDGCGIFENGEIRAGTTAGCYALEGPPGRRPRTRDDSPRWPTMLPPRSLGPHRKWAVRFCQPRSDPGSLARRHRPAPRAVRAA